MRPSVTSSMISAAAALWVAACIPSTDFDDRELIKSPRILAIIADPPEAAPGEDVTLRIFSGAMPEGVRYAWSVCPLVESFGTQGFGGAQYGMMDPPPGCSASAGAFVLPGEGPSTTLPGAVTQAAFDNLEELGETFGDRLPPDTLRLLAEEIGVPVAVGVRVFDGDRELVAAYKRVLLSLRSEQGTNPPPPRFELNGMTLEGRERDGDLVCLPEGVPTTELGRVPMPPATELFVMPDPNDEPWIETYNVLDPQGGVVVKSERAFYSFYTTAGAFNQTSTHAPDRNTRWYSPAAPGPASLYYIVRDGHGGTSACRLDVEVLPSP